MRPGGSPSTYAQSPVDSYSAAAASGNPSPPRDRYPSSSSAYPSSPSAYPSSPRDPYSAASPSPSQPETSHDSYSKAWSGPTTPATPDTGRTYGRSGAAAADENDFSAAGRPRTPRSGNAPSPTATKQRLPAERRRGLRGAAQRHFLADFAEGLRQRRAISRPWRSTTAARSPAATSCGSERRSPRPRSRNWSRAIPSCARSPATARRVRSRASLASAHGGYGGGRTYEVQEGDTLFDIARNELGKASRWAEIYDLNRDALGKDFDYLTPGMQLILPPKDAPASIDKTTRRPGPVYDR